MPSFTQQALSLSRGQDIFGLLMVDQVGGNARLIKNPRLVVANKMYWESRGIHDLVKH